MHSRWRMALIILTAMVSHWAPKFDDNSPSYACNMLFCAHFPNRTVNSGFIVTKAMIQIQFIDLAHCM